eukprot:GHVR01034435.1.p1 GENE.GHVR01034435.1~~GHVR01034435.1.p1  ORF type:complete len:148 (+),score=35.51 GHVR01034435.1:105-548(+)
MCYLHTYIYIYYIYIYTYIPDVSIACSVCIASVYFIKYDSTHSSKTDPRFPLLVPPPLSPRVFPLPPLFSLPPPPLSSLCTYVSLCTAASFVYTAERAASMSGDTPRDVPTLMSGPAATSAFTAWRRLLLAARWMAETPTHGVSYAC